MVPFDAPDAVKLIAEVQQEYVERYGGPDTTPVDPAEFAPPQGIFLVGYLDGAPVACGGWRVHGDEAEIKRMYVAASARGNGFARALLAELERTAAEAGLARVRLETGQKQPEAIALYESSGYHRIPGFGIYRDEPDCVCFAKHLA
ncbi:N-acetyltransferase [Amycolatopsis taiwanensis]|uniref:N-acetyltransferase n=2 Tax=Amycolatopsis taiwanensis TaxID=342230 RepID=A0A9W6R0C0_9PSEU|nr:N-acetyltransferase [Amycolatopsis taiwanensis]